MNSKDNKIWSDVGCMPVARDLMQDSVSSDDLCLYTYADKLQCVVYPVSTIPGLRIGVTLDRGKGELPRHAANAQPAAEAADISRWLALRKLPETFEFLEISI